ncbi:glutathione-dependent formaldehyde-activating protein [Clohesyomyces aquaticus]|uniref:Glutathione-dependent formaldehyde-activating protein n=1 Tax=Clohesyomyces aquaticus TaxID=1231657 RepID=A0A1Y2A6Y1_9PLEO|nr:glutathione-dependent formaldehyde-activating protein [Clohesyomyces aquaticus]
MAAPQQAHQSITCHCKAIRVTFPPLREPALECLCSICRRYGALWAYYKPDEVHVEGETEAYVWGKKTLSFNRCKECGCMTHYTVVGDTEPRVAVNCRMLDKEEYNKLESVESDGEGE